MDLAVTDEVNIKKLYLNRMDNIILDESVGWWLIEKNYPDEIDKFATIKKAEREARLFLIVGKKNSREKRL